MSRLGNILNKIAANACIEKGTSGDWMYKKYADGTVASGQCHGVYEVGRSTTGTAFYPIRASSDSTANNRQINIYIWGKLVE